MLFQLPRTRLWQKRNIQMTGQTASPRIEKLLWFGGLALVLFCLALLLDGTLSKTRGGDGPSYLILARSLVEGYGYADINIPGAPPHTQYPPVFPLLLTPIYLAFGYNFLLSKLVIVASAVASLFVVRAFFSGHGGKLYGTFIAVLTGTNFFFLFYTNEIQSEIPYLFLSFLALLYASRHVPKPKAYQLFLALPLLLALAYMTRMIGVTLVAAAFVTVLLALRGREGLPAGLKKTILFGAAASVPFVIWNLRNSIYSQDIATYQSIFAQADYYSLDSGSAGLGSLFARFSLNSGYYFECIYEMLALMPASEDGFWWAALIAVFLLVMAGFVKELFCRREMKDFYFLFYLGLLTVWPVFGQGDAQRYLVPLIPFLYHYLFSGFAFVWGGAASLTGRTTIGRGAGFLALAMLLAVINTAGISYRSANPSGWNFDGGARVLDGGLFRNVQSLGLDDLGANGLKKTMPCFYNYLLAADTIKGSLADSDVLMARKPEIVYLLIDKPVVRFPYTSQAELMESFIKEKGVSHILLDSCYVETDRYARKFVMSRPERVSVMVSDGQVTVALKLQ